MAGKSSSIGRFGGPSQGLQSHCAEYVTEFSDFTDMPKKRRACFFHLFLERQLEVERDEPVYTNSYKYRF